MPEFGPGPAPEGEPFSAHNPNPELKTPAPNPLEPYAEEIYRWDLTNNFVGGGNFIGEGFFGNAKFGSAFYDKLERMLAEQGYDSDQADAFLEEIRERNRHEPPIQN
jgi:hypothetical protein